MQVRPSIRLVLSADPSSSAEPEGGNRPADHASAALGRCCPARAFVPPVTSARCNEWSGARVGSRPSPPADLTRGRERVARCPGLRRLLGPRTTWTPAHGHPKERLSVISYSERLGGKGHRKSSLLRGPQGPCSADLCVLTMPKTRARSGRTDPKPQGDPNDQKWNVRCDELAAYKAKHGHCKVPTGRKTLGRWVNNQRSNYRKGKLSEKRIQKLEDLGFDWGTARGSQLPWDERFDALTEYQRAYGECNVPRGHETLGTWVRDQRQLKKKGKLPKERVQKLDNLGFDWSPRGTPPTWDDHFD
ncbi:hypothetical protein THAOC_17398, partial [Thalassiosira oceanica]